MEYRRLGRTNLEVSSISYGASPLGSNFRPVDEQDGIATVHAAIDLGINLIDCSPHYGMTIAETILGKALKTVPREKYYLATKVGRWGDHFDFSPERIRQSLDESMKRLGVDYIDIFQLHDIEFVDIQAMIGPAMETLASLKSEGKIRHYGITGYPPAIFTKVVEEYDYQVDTVLTYGNYTLANRNLENITAMLREKDIGIINASVLGMGLFTERGAPEWWGFPEELKVRCKDLYYHFKKKNCNLAKLALQFAVSNSNVASTLVGTADINNLRQNIEWVKEPIDGLLLAEAEEIIGDMMNTNIVIGRTDNN